MCRVFDVSLVWSFIVDLCRRDHAVFPHPVHRHYPEATIEGPLGCLIRAEVDEQVAGRDFANVGKPSQFRCLPDVMLNAAHLVVLDRDDENNDVAEGL